jgi:hypothetical protein
MAQSRRRRRRRRRALHRLLVGLTAPIVLLLAAFFIWPTPYAYRQVALGESLYNVRISRMSGSTQMLRTWGWENADAVNLAAVTLDDLPQEQMALLDGTPTIDWGSLQYEIHNRSPFTLWELTAVLTVRDSFGSVARTQTYTLRNSTSSVRCSPGATAIFFARLGFNLRPGETWTAHVLRARGTP